MVVRRTPRPTIASAMAFVALVAAILASVHEMNYQITDFISFLLIYILPLDLLLRFRAPKSAAEIAYVALAGAYLAGCCAPLLPRHRPGRGLAKVERRPECESGTRLLRVLQTSAVPIPAVWMGESRSRPLEFRPARGLLCGGLGRVLLRSRRWLSRSDLGGSPQSASGHWGVYPTAELVVASWLLLGLFMILYDEIWNRRDGWATLSGIAPQLLKDSGVWLRAAGLVGVLVLAVVNWRARPASWKLSRLVARLARLVPAVVAGAILGFLWSWCGWQYLIEVASLLLLIALLIAPRRRSGLRGALCIWSRR